MIIVVSGLPRSGTSMMMKMLEETDIPILTDKIREADEDNIKGYYEDERVKQLHQDNTWISEAENKAVKVISYQLRHLPSGHVYKIIFMKRNITEILASQRKMMQRRGEPQDDVSETVMANIFHKHLNETDQWLNKQPNMKILYINYNETLYNPETTAEQVAKFLEQDLDIEKMIQIVDSRFYRQRK
ncbi:sulfotransferase domain-containing protein [Thermoproteota archaeon]